MISALCANCHQQAASFLVAREWLKSSTHMHDRPPGWSDPFYIPGRNDIHQTFLDPVAILPAFPMFHPIPPVSFGLVDAMKHDSIRFKHEHSRSHGQICEIGEIGLISFG